MSVHQEPPHTDICMAKEILHFVWKLPRVWRKTGEAQKSSCLKSTVKFPQSVMVWRAMSSAGVGPLSFIKSTVNAPVYQEILQHFKLPASDELFGDDYSIFYNNTHQQPFQNWLTGGKGSAAFLDRTNNINEGCEMRDESKGFALSAT